MDKHQAHLAAQQMKDPNYFIFNISSEQITVTEMNFISVISKMPESNTTSFNIIQAFQLHQSNSRQNSKIKKTQNGS